MPASAIRSRVRATRRRIHSRRTTALSHVTGAHSFKLGVEFRRNQINMTEGIASNGFFVFAPFPLSDSFASFLFGFPVVFFQGGGDMNRGLRNIDFAAYGQDEWRVTPRLTINYGLRWEVSTPFIGHPQPDELLVARQAIDGVPECPDGAAVPGRSGRAGRHRAGVLERADAARGPGVGPDRLRQDVHSRGLRNVLRLVHQRSGRTAAGAAERAALDAGAAACRRRSISPIPGTARIRSRRTPFRSRPPC